VQVPPAVPVPVAAASQVAPDHAFTKLPLAAVAVSVTFEADGNEALQPVPAAPALIEQEMPAGLEVTVPLPFAPPSTESE
jgi:hypothetical protein